MLGWQRLLDKRVRSRLRVLAGGLLRKKGRTAGEENMKKGDRARMMGLLGEIVEELKTVGSSGTPW